MCNTQGPAVIMGPLDAEKEWVEQSSAQLPAFPDKQARAVMLASDEMQFVFCNSTDCLVTRYPMDAAHKSYLLSLGYLLPRTVSLIRRETEDTLKKNVFELICSSKQAGIPAGSRLNPYAVVGYVREAAAQYAFLNKFPEAEVVRRVNSKVYSTTLKQELLEYDPTQAQVIQNAGSLLSFANQTGAQEPFLIKEEFGVAGKGTMLIENRQMLDRLYRHLQRQEKAGAGISLVAEKLLQKDKDFSCNFEILENGAVRFLSTNQMLNNGFTFEAIEDCGAELSAFLGRTSYYDILGRVAKRMFHEGYFGPVCVDSMLLEDGTLLPIVEINARKSMSSFKNAVDQRFFASGQSSMLSSSSFLSMSVPDFSGVLERLKQQRLLYEKGAEHGILPLSANTMAVNYRPGQKYKGRIYFYAIAPSSEECGRLVQKVQGSLSELGCQTF